MKARSLASFASFVSVVLLAAATAGPVLGHHLIAEVYDVKRTMTVDGRVDRIVLRNPHAYVHLSVVDTEGQSRTWAIELEGATTLRRRGVDGATFKIGDQLTVCGNPGRDASQYRLLMLELRRPSDSFSMHRRVEESEADCTP